MPPTVLITGATGAVGPSVVAAFHEAGYRIRTLSRRIPETGMFPVDVESKVIDVTDPSAVQDALEGVDTVIHMAGLLHINNPPDSVRKEYERINVGGTRTLVESTAKADVKRVVFFSTISVYGSSDGQILDENSDVKPGSLYAETKLAAESAVLNAKRKDGLGIGTVLRLAAVYGPRVKANYLRLTTSLAKGRFLPIGKGLNRRTLIYDKDVANAAVLTAQHPDVAGRIYNVSDGKFHSLNEIVATICAALGRRPRKLSVPVSLAQFLSTAVENGFSLLGCRSPVTRDMIDKYLEDVAVDASLIQKELGFVPQYDLLNGWTETIRQMRLARDI
jgi:nucleoside-diphosphate-sugar epimerase